jgi:K+-sensing histidine kinase KdpD
MQRLWRSATLCAFGAIGLALITFACDRLHFNVATAGFLYVIVVVLVSRIGDLVSSILVCVVAVLCLAYIAPPAFSFRVDDPLDVVAIIAFLMTSVTVARLVSKLRKMAKDARFPLQRASQID